MHQLEMERGRIRFVSIPFSEAPYKEVVDFIIVNQTLHSGNLLYNMNMTNLKMHRLWMRSELNMVSINCIFACKKNKQLKPTNVPNNIPSVSLLLRDSKSMCSTMLC